MALSAPGTFSRLGNSCAFGKRVAAVLTLTWSDMKGQAFSENRPFNMLKMPVNFFFHD